MEVSIMDETQKKEIIQKYISSYNSFDIEGMLSTIHDDIKFKNISNDDITAKATNIEEFKDLVLQAKAIFKDRKQKIDSIEFNKEKTIINISYQGVLAIDLPNGLKAGQSLILEGKSEFCFKDNKISELTDIS
jgi:hypothetical protein